MSELAANADQQGYPSGLDRKPRRPLRDILATALTLDVQVGWIE